MDNEESGRPLEAARKAEDEPEGKGGEARDRKAGDAATGKTGKTGESGESGETAGSGNPGESLLELAGEHAARIVEERLSAFREEMGAKERESLLEGFAAANPDFKELAENGGLAALQRENPLLDELGAYFAHRLAEERAGFEEKIGQAVAEAEERMLGRLRAKRLAASLGDAAAQKDGDPQPELAAPEKFGGLNAVIAARLAARRNADER